MLLAAIAVAGAAGALARHTVHVVAARRAGTVFPGGTLLINITGSFALGVITGLALYHGLATDTRAIAGTGFCGGYTTFSTFTVEALTAGDTTHTRRYALASMAVPAAAAALGLALTAI
jgi:CrcB protein